MTTEFKSIIERLNGNDKFIELGDFHTDNKKYVSTIIFKTDDSKLRLQLPPCYTKAGIVDLANRTYTDLLFDNSTENVKDMINLFLTLESIVSKELHSKSDTLFAEGAENMTLEDFEDMFTSTIRLLNRQTNVCIRVDIPTSNKNIKQSNKFIKCDVYNQKGETRELCDIKKETQILPLIEVNFINITSTSINLHINLVECMILNDEPSRSISERRIQLAPIAKKDNIVKTEDSRNDNDDQTPKLEMKPLIEPVSQNKDGLDIVPNEEVNLIPVELKEEPVNEDEDTNVNEHDDEDDNDHDNVSTNDLREVDITLDNDDKMLEIDNLDINNNDTITLKKPDEVYKDLYKVAIAKAKKLRQVALEAYLDAKKIKAKFMLKDIYDTDDGDEDEDDSELDELNNDF